jgi:hypothetical protein
LPRLEGQGRHAAEAVVWPLLVVFRDSLFGDVTHPLERLEQICIQHFFGVGTTEAIDERVLIGLAGLDVVQIDLLLCLSNEVA